MYDSHLEQLPPELLEKIFKAFVADVKQLKHIAQTCSKFHFVVLKVNDYMSNYHTQNTQTSLFTRCDASKKKPNHHSFLFTK